jgi:hypothetical protein
MYNNVKTDKQSAKNEIFVNYRNNLASTVFKGLKA